MVNLLSVNLKFYKVNNEEISHPDIIKLSGYAGQTGTILGFIKGKALHIVTAQCENHVRIITVYEPDEMKWVEFRKRKE